MKTVLTLDWDNQSCCVKTIGDKGTPHFIFSISICGITFKGINPMLLLPDDKTATVNVSAVDAKGFPANIENIIFSSTDETIVSVDAAGVITPVGIGTASVNVTADALLGEGEVLLAGILEVQVIAGQAVGLNISATINEV